MIMNDPDGHEQHNLDESYLKSQSPTPEEQTIQSPKIDAATPKSVISRDKESLGPTPNPLNLEQSLGNTDKFLEYSPFINSDSFRTSFTPRLSYQSSYSPVSKRSPIQSLRDFDSSRSPFVFSELNSNSSRTGFRIVHPIDSDSRHSTNEEDTSFLPIRSTIGNTSNIEMENDFYNKNLIYPHTPNIMNGTNPPLFDKLYYSPLNSTQLSRPLFGCQSSDQASDANLIDIQLTLRSPVTGSLDADIDFDSMRLDTHALLQKPPKLNLHVDLPHVDEVATRCTVFRFNSESNEDKAEICEDKTESTICEDKKLEVNTISTIAVLTEKPEDHDETQLKTNVSLGDEDGSFIEDNCEDDSFDDDSFPLSAHHTRSDTIAVHRQRSVSTRYTSQHHRHDSSKAYTEDNMHSKLTPKSISDFGKKRGFKRHISSRPPVEKEESDDRSVEPSHVSSRSVNRCLPLSAHPCNCKKSRCLKLYCECFSADTYCSGCNCISCLNNKDHYKEREEAKQVLLSRNGSAFKPRVVSDPQLNKINLKGCNCRKTGCLKKYCECFQAGIACSPNCKCIDCHNGEDCSSFTVMKRSARLHSFNGTVTNNRSDSSDTTEDDNLTHSVVYSQ